LIGKVVRYQLKDGNIYNQSLTPPSTAVVGKSEGRPVDERYEFKPSASYV